MAYPFHHNSDDEIAEARRRYEQTRDSIRSIAEYLRMSHNTLDRRIDLWGWVRRRDGRLQDAPFTRTRAGGRKRAAVQPTPETAAVMAQIETGALGPAQEAAQNLAQETTKAPPPLSQPAASETAAEARPVAWQGKICTGLLACPERTVLIAKLWASVQRQIARIDGVHGDFVARGGPPHAGEAEGYAKLIASLARSLRELANLDAALQDKDQPGKAAGKSGTSADVMPDRDAFRDELARRLAALEGEEGTSAATTPA